MRLPLWKNALLMIVVGPALYRAARRVGFTRMQALGVVVFP